jgi:5-methylcytosine-specific restriction protein A
MARHDVNKKIRRQHYDKFYRDPQSRKFYNSAQWKKAKEMKLARDPLCEICRQEGRTTLAQVAHHLFPVKKGERKLELDFLVSLCHEHHNRVETEMEKDRGAA